MKMKRTILFRGKAKTITPTYEPEGTWVYGFYNEIDDMSVIERKQDFCQVEKDSVGQYTGLMDRNGKRVFEGDIVKYTFDDGYFEILLVIWNESSCRFEFVEKRTKEHIDIYVDKNSEVIGNVTDNVELLKV